VRVLVLGGAGYVGSHVVLELLAEGHYVEVVDNLSTGHKRLVPAGLRFHREDVYDHEMVAPILRDGCFDAVMHFAALSLVGESVANPRKYFEENVCGGMRLIGACVDAKVPAFILSSSASVYGEPRVVPIPEDSPVMPINPYGATKATLERVLEAYSKAYGMKFAALRYFNAAGAHPLALAGEMHDPETHLIPNVLKAALAGTPVSVFGNDYETRDGTCIRDYVHVCDLAEAHILAVLALNAGHEGGPINLGSSTGMSVFEIIESARRVTGRQIQVDLRPRRPGDPPTLIADSSRARTELHWEPKHSDADTIIRSAWAWHSRPWPSDGL